MKKTTVLDRVRAQEWGIPITEEVPVEQPTPEPEPTPAAKTKRKPKAEAADVPNA